MSVKENLAKYLMEVHNVSNFDFGLGANGYWRVSYGRVTMYIKLEGGKVIDVQVD